MYIPVPLQMLLNEFYKIVCAIRPRARTRRPRTFRAGGQDLFSLLSRQLFRRHRDVQPLDFQVPFFRVAVLTRQGNLGPEGGERGGTVVAEGTPEHVATVKESYTGRFLARML